LKCVAVRNILFLPSGHNHEGVQILNYYYYYYYYRPRMSNAFLDDKLFNRIILAYTCTFF